MNVIMIFAAECRPKFKVKVNIAWLKSLTLAMTENKSECDWTAVKVIMILTGESVGLLVFELLSVKVTTTYISLKVKVTLFA